MKTYTVTGMSCAACSARVERAVKGIEGVDFCSVNLLTGTLSVSGAVSDERIKSAVLAAGYGIAEESKKTEEGEDEGARVLLRLRQRFLWSLFALLPLSYVSMGGMLGLPLPSFLGMGTLGGGILQAVLSAAVLLICYRLFVNGVRGALVGAPNMDTLVSLGSGVSYVYSVYALITGEHTLYFESAAMILVLITLGKMLEARAKGKTTDALRSLLSLSPEVATVERDGRELTVQACELQVGDTVILRPGERVPVDGVVTQGEGAFDESALTGESIPVDKGVGADVFAATVNLSGYVKFRATGVGEETALARIIKTVKDASATKAPIAKLADRVAGVFVPVVLGISLVTLVVWRLSGVPLGEALSYAISVLVVSCPCALGLATPVAVMVGSGVGAKNGILYKTAAALEEMGRVSTVVFDKTGTLTEGRPEVTDVLAFDKDARALLSYAYAVEAKSEHPLAGAVVRYAKKAGIPLREVTDFRTYAGHGVYAVLDGEEILGGKRDFVCTRAAFPDEGTAVADALSREGKTPLYFAKGNVLLGMIAVADKIKPDARDAVERLAKMGIRTVMLTGDNEQTAFAVARLVGIDEVRAGVLPEEKAYAVRELKKNGKVMMVGDGINDAPALTEADVGAAIGCGTDIAVDAAGVVLTKETLFAVCDAACLSRAVLRVIKQNLFWAFFYNLIGIPLAAGVFVPLFGFSLPPMFGAAAMGLSSLCVVSNALRLNAVRLTKDQKQQNIVPKTKGNEKMQTTIYIEGMMCPHCSGRVKTALEALEGVSEARVSHEDGTAVVTHTGVAEKVLEDTVAAAGYTVKK